MKEIEGVNLFDFLGTVDVICITTNGVVKNNGHAVMGAGCAKEAKDRWPVIANTLGDCIKKSGNVVSLLGFVDCTRIYSFPVKHHWKDAADLDLIRASAYQLKEEMDRKGLNRVVLPRPGCGNGRLQWPEVKAVLENILDDRFIVVTR